MESKLFPNIKTFLVTSIVGLASFFFLSNTFFNSIQDIFKFENIKCALIIFSLSYFIVPVLILSAWFYIYSNSRIIKSKNLLISGIAIWIILLGGFIAYLLNPILILYDYWLVVIVLLFFILILFYAIWICWKGWNTNKGLITEFAFIFLLCFSLIIVHFSTNLAFVKKKIIIPERVFESYNIHEKAKRFAESTTQVNLRIAKEIEHMQHRMADEDTLILNQQISIPVKQKFALNSDLGILIRNMNQDYLQLDSSRSYFVGDFKTIKPKIFRDSLTQIMNRIKDSQQNIINSINDENSKHVSSIVQLLLYYAEIDKAFYRSTQNLFKRDWANLLNGLALKGLYFLFFWFLILLCLFYQSSLKSNSNNAKYRNAINFKKTGNRYSAMNKHELPEVKIIQSSLSLLFVLILLIIKPVEEKNISLDKPFITMNIQQILGNEIDNSPLYNPTFIYNIDSLINNNTVVNHESSDQGVGNFDIDSFTKRLKDKKLQFVHDTVIAEIKNIHADLHIIHANDTAFHNQITTLADSDILKSKIKINLDANDLPLKQHKN